MLWVVVVVGLWVTVGSQNGCGSLWFITRRCSGSHEEEALRIFSCSLSSMSLHVVVFPPLLYTILSIHNHRDLFKETREEKSICDCDGESPILFSFKKSFHYKRMKNGGTFKFNK